MYNSDLSWREVMGLTKEAPAQAWMALRGDASVPGSRFGTSSLRQFAPRLAIPTWLGKTKVARRAVIMNLVNHTPTPVEEGWSVRITQVHDFRGRGLTYDSHNGTDFAVPPGTPVVAAAPGRVVSLRSEYNRGGLKLAIDHGSGLLTSSNHLARALVKVGDVVTRGQHVAISGYSGLDALVSFPWVAPHVHYNVALGGVLVDPFAAQHGEHGTSSLWRRLPLEPWHAHEGAVAEDAAFAPTRFDADRTAALLSDLKDAKRRAALATIEDPALRAWELVLEALTYPMRFSSTRKGSAAGAALFEANRDAPVRRAILDLPFSPSHIDGAVFGDDVGLRHAPARAPHEEHARHQ
jgi:murein DD-endopeptidase MepM/ murein hydrolase activator NlpD